MSSAKRSGPPLVLTERMLKSVACSLTSFSFDCEQRCHEVPLHLFTDLTRLSWRCYCGSNPLFESSLASITSLTNLTSLSSFASLPIQQLSCLQNLQQLFLGDALESEQLSALFPLKSLTYLYEEDTKKKR